jgi:hypothetical protein
MSRSPKISLLLGLVAAAVALIFPAAAQASTNVVPNPGFEQGGCGAGTPVICGWKLLDDSSGTCGGAGACTSTTMYQDTANPHSGAASMSLQWGTDLSSGWGGVEADTDPAFCAPIGPGGHPASFWYGNAFTDGYYVSVSLGAAFYQTPDCTGTASGASLEDTASGEAWKQVAGVLVAPPGTQSALFSVGVGTQCDYAAGCSVSANFDDLDVESAVVTTPAIGSFAPGNGTVGTSVDIRGVNFTGATSVSFNGVPASFTVDSDQEIHATVPAGATTGPISVTTPSGTGTSNLSFSVTPVISSFTPTCGPVGTSVDILGSGFTGALEVTFGGTDASFTVDSDSEIHATAPAWGAISVSTPSGTGISTSSFTFPCAAPTINSFSPMSGPVGTSVDIQGTNFTGATSVKFNGTSDPSFIVSSSTDITAHVPAEATTGPISVTTPGGIATSSSSFTVIGPAPTIASFSPTGGPPGTNVSITGTDFTGATAVTFHGTADPSFVVNSPSSITAHVPIGATTGPIAVTTAGGTGSSSSSFTVIAPPTITGFSPTSGHTGQQVTITGTNFTGVTGVKLGTTAARFTLNSRTKITATVPSIAPGVYKWSVATPGGTATSTGSFHVT